MTSVGFLMDVDVDDVQIAILDENIKTTNELSTDISAQLAKLARINKQAVYSVTPLVHKIHELKLRQANLHAIDEKVGEVKAYASRVRRLLDIVAQANQAQGQGQGLRGVSEIQKYIAALDGLDQVDSELKGHGLDGFEGLKESLGEGVLDGELALKAGLMSKLKQIGEIQLRGGGDEGDKAVRELVEEVRLIYAYLTDGRQMSLEDLVLRDRANFVKREIVRYKPEKPVLNKDQNYIYDGAKAGTTSSFPDYTQKMTAVLGRELTFMRQLFEGLVPAAMLAKVLAKVVRPVTDAYIYELNGLVEFVEMHRLSYSTMYYELATGASNMVSWLAEHQVGSPGSNTLQQLAERCNTETKRTFKDFFEYVRQRYSEMVVPAVNTTGSTDETLNNTFMLVATRIHKMTVFRSYQLEAIAGMAMNEWLPASLPAGFVSEKAASRDPQFLLGTFYSDVIEYSFYSLAARFQEDRQRSEEAVGIMLLFNLDGLQSLLEGGTSVLKQIIGRRGVERYERLKKKAMDKAVAPWSALAARLMAASTKQGEQLSMGHKELGKFIDEFNARFEEQCASFRRKEVPPFFRQQMVADVSKTLVPSYKIFYAHAGGGARGVAKHFQMTPEELAQRLSRLG